MLERAHLQLLLALRELGRLGDAAEVLHISASAASHRLREAERRLGVPLTVSDGRTLRLTDAGVALAAASGDIERDIERAELTARWMGGGESGRVRVAVGFFDTASWLLETFGPVNGHPRTELLRFADAELVAAVRRGRADVAVAPWPVPPSGMTNVALCEDRLVAAVPTGGPLAHRSELEPDELYAETFLTSSYQARRGFEFNEYFLASGFVPTTVIQVQSLEMMLRLVGQGHGVTIQPSMAVTWNRHHDDVAIVPLAGRPITVAWAASHAPDAPVAVSSTAHRIAEAFGRAWDSGEGALA